MIGEPGLSVVSFFGAARLSSSATGTARDMRDYTGIAHVILNAGASASGTDPTLDVKIIHSHDNTTWADVTGATFTQATGTAGSEKITINMDEVRRYVTAYAELGGTTPEFVFSVDILAMDGSV